MFRTHRCGDLCAKIYHQNISSQACIIVKVAGWVHRRRDLGGLLLIDLRDVSGIIQLNFSQFNKDKNILELLQRESVIEVAGELTLRPEHSINHTLFSGEVELMVDEVIIHNHVVKGSLPFLFDAKVDTKENLLMKYRYLQLRDPKYQEIILKRSCVMNEVRRYLVSRDFIEIDTPVLFKPTPEGARDFVIPSRHHPGKMYALPQSPQILKQLLMISGIDRYFQIARSFRDEDQRSDRQPEFTQIDLEASFIDREDLKDFAWGICKAIWKNQSIQLQSISYQHSMTYFGCDKPDLRFGLILSDLDKLNLGDNLLIDGIKGYSFKGVFIPKRFQTLSRKKIEDIAKSLEDFGFYSDLKLFYFKSGQGELSSGIAKYLSIQIFANIKEIFSNDHNIASKYIIKNCQTIIDGPQDLDDGLYIIVCHKNYDHALQSICQVRKYLAKEFGLMDNGVYAFAWVYDFPLFIYDYSKQIWESAHHPFTSPIKKSLEQFLSIDDDHLDISDPDLPELKNLVSTSCDIVCNGYELGTGSIRFHRADHQIKMFKLLKMTKDQYTEDFGFLIEALKSGAPIHGGIGLGLDRIIMLVCGLDNIRDVIAFPKTTKGTCLLSNSPSSISDEDLDELNLKNIKKVEN